MRLPALVSKGKVSIEERVFKQSSCLDMGMNGDENRKEQGRLLVESS
jgi:hypothetical protein